MKARPAINAHANERLAKLEALVAQLDKHLDNLEQGQHWIVGLYSPRNTESHD